MSVAGALGALAGWSVTGVVTSYGMDETPGLLPASALPALIIAPAIQTPASDGRAFDLELTAGAWRLEIDHVLLLAGSAYGKPQTSFAAMLTLIDNYAAAVRADWYLSDNLLEPLQISAVQMRPYPLGGGVYWAVVFRHLWALKL